MAIRIKPVFSSTGTAGRVAVFDPSTGLITASVVTTDELELLSGISGGDILTEDNVKTVSGKTLAQDVVFDADNTRDIGSSGVKAKDAYLAGQLNAASASISGDVTISGNLYVQGSGTEVITEELLVEDPTITVNDGGDDTTAEGAGLVVERASTNAQLIHANASATKFRAGAAGSEVDLVGTSSAQTLTSKTLVVASNTITTASSGNLAATELNSALAELQADVDTRATTTELNNHLTDTADAHAASAIGVTANGNLSSTNAQAAFQELQGDADALAGRLDTAEADIDQLELDVVAAQAAADAAQTSIDDHLADATGAHAASAISVTPAGNLAADDAQEAFEELQADVDTRALDSDLDALDARVTTAESDIDTLEGRVDTAEGDIGTLETDLATHIADTSTHGVSGAIVGTTDAQAISNKDIDGGTASDTSRITLPKETKANLDALTRKEGTVVYGTDTQKAYVDDGTDLIPIGSGSGGGAGINLITLDSSFTPGANPNNFDFEDSTDGVGTWAVYADTAASAPEDMTGGTAGTTIARITSGELNGSASAQVDLGSGSSRQGEGWVTSVHVPPAYRGRTLTCLMPYSITGAVVENDLVPYCYDVTNSALIKPYVKDKFLGSSGVAHFTFPVSTTTAEVRVGVHIARSSTTALSLVFDDVQISPFSTPVGVAGSDWTTYTPTYTGFGIVTDSNIEWRRNGDALELRGSFVSGTSTATEARLSLPAGLTSVAMVAYPQRAGAWTQSVTLSGNGHVLIGSAVQYITFGYETGGSAGLTGAAGDGIIASGTRMSINAVGIKIAGWSANVSMAESSTYWISSFLANGTRVTAAPTKLGEYRTYVKSSSSNSGTDNAPSAQPSNSNGMLIYGVNYATAGTSGQPNRWEIFVGKNKTVRPQFYSSTGRTGYVATVLAFPDGSTTIGLNKSYDPTTGVLVIDAMTGRSGDSGRYVGYSLATAGGSAAAVSNAYFDIQVSENALAVGVQAPRSYVEVSGGNGHGSTNTTIRRFSTVNTNVGSAIVYADSATAGASFTIKEDGIYSVTYADGRSTSGSAYFGVSLNSTQLTTSVSGANGVKTYTQPASSDFGSVSTTFYAAAGSVVRAHTNGSVDRAPIFSITKVSN